MNTRPRIIPTLLIEDKGLVKTINFSKSRYLGDPINAVKIFNDKGVDELCILDIRATLEKRGPDFEYLEDIASEAFVPLSYGGGITTIEEIKRLFYIGYEKVIINTEFIKNPELIRDASKFAGSQSIVVSIDVKTEFLGRRNCYIKSGTEKIKINPIELAKMAEEYGAGEILLNSITKDGTMSGFDLDLIKKVSGSVSIPVIACGGAKDINDLKLALKDGKADAVAAGSMFVYYGKQKAVLINYLEEKEIEKLNE